MKKKIVCILLVLFFMFAFTTSFAYTEVYITNSGSKYHTSSCQYLRKSKIAIDLDKAIKQGYSACSKCGAGSLSVVTTSNPSSTNQKVQLPTYTKADIEGTIQIPSKDGSIERYENIYTFEDLYSVLEDLSVNYRALLDEYNSLETQLKEKNSVIRELQNNIDEYENQPKRTDNSSYIGFGFILIISIYVAYHIGLDKSQKKYTNYITVKSKQ